MKNFKKFIAKLLNKNSLETALKAFVDAIINTYKGCEKDSVLSNFKSEFGMLRWRKADFFVEVFFCEVRALVYAWIHKVSGIH